MSSKSKHVLVESELKKLQDKIEKLQHIVKIFLLIKATFSMMEHNFTSYFTRFIVL